MQIKALPYKAMSVVLVLALQACSNTEKPAYPPELQMIIATSAQPEPSAKQNPNAMTVAQLLESVRNSKKQRSPSTTKQHTNPNAVQPLPQWIFTGEQQNQEQAKQTNQAKEQYVPIKPVTTNQRQLQLTYQSDNVLPNQMQLMIAKQMLEKQNMQLINLIIGSSAGKTPINSAANAQKRAIHLLKELNPATDATIEYKPQLGNDIVVVTFAPRGH